MTDNPQPRHKGEHRTSRFAAAMLRTLTLSLLVLLPVLPGCAVVTVAGAAAGAAISVTGAVVSTGISVTGAAVKAGIEAASDDDDQE